MKTPLIVTVLVILIAIFYSCSSTRSNSSSSGNSSSSLVKVSGPGSSPDTIHVNLPAGPRRYYMVVKKSGPGSSPDTISLQSGQPVIIYKSKDDSKKP